MTLFFGAQTRAIPTLLLPVVLCAAIPSDLMAVAVIRCQLTNGEVLFTDRACPQQAIAQSEADTSAIMLMPALSKQQLKRADDLFTADQQARQAVHNQRRKAARARATEQRNRDRLCDQAREKLAALRSKRRSGYSAAEATRLAQTEHDLRQDRRDYCH
ncbi:MAG: hypothetical protein RIC89_12660 [Pseudomonadales bacterium]